MADPLTLDIQSSYANYKVAFSDLNDLSECCFEADAFLVDAFFRDRLPLPANVPVVWIEANEDAKALPATIDVFIALKQAGLGRGSHLIAIGGGVIQDIATFVASLYMRGIDWSYVPTTFLGMVDSCLGGKSSINVGPYKNLVGNFHPPRRIEILPVFARSLPMVEMAGGAAEAAKISFCRGKTTFANYEQLASPVVAGVWTEEQLAQLLHATLAVKKWFIEKDEFDQAERRLLNFGHTWGHALESATAFAIPHGLAVGLGMMAAIRFVGREKADSLLWEHCMNLLKPILLLEQLTVFDADVFVKAFRADKKHSPGHFHLIVPTAVADSGLGVEEIRLRSDDDSLARILKAMQEVLVIVSDQLSDKKSLANRL